MEDLPGIVSLPIVYQDDDVFIRANDQTAYVYHLTEYTSPLHGILKKDWLCSGIWNHRRDNKWHEGYSNKSADTFETIAGIVRNR